MSKNLHPIATFSDVLRSLFQHVTRCARGASNPPMHTRCKRRGCVYVCVCACLCVCVRIFVCKHALVLTGVGACMCTCAWLCCTCTSRRLLRSDAAAVRCASAHCMPAMMRRCACHERCCQVLCLSPEVLYTVYVVTTLVQHPPTTSFAGHVAKGFSLRPGVSQHCELNATAFSRCWALVLCFQCWLPHLFLPKS